MLGAVLAVAVVSALLVFVRCGPVDSGARLRSVWQVRRALIWSWTGVVMVAVVPVAVTVWNWGREGVLVAALDAVFVALALVTGWELYRRGVAPLTVRLRILHTRMVD